MYIIQTKLLDFKLLPHAVARIGIRSKLSPAEILAILQAHAYIRINAPDGSSDVGLLFWSQMDDCAFIAQCNGDTGEIITVYQAKDGTVMRNTGPVAWWRKRIYQSHISRAKRKAKTFCDGDFSSEYAIAV